MRSVPVKTIAFATVLAALGSVPVAGASEAQPDDLPAHVSMTYDGPVMVTPAGMTLYAYDENSLSEKFAWQCTNVPPTRMNDQQSGIGERPQTGFKLLKSCVQKFPVYVAPAGARPVGDFTIVTRPDGVRQWAYKGYPLYTSVRDHKPGDRNGTSNGGFGGGNARFGGNVRLAWMAMDIPTGFKLSRQELGLVVATVDNDRPVYTPRGGSRLWQASLGGAEFKPLAAPAIASVSGDWTVIDGGTGVKQYAFRGKPLFRAPAGVSDDEIMASGWDLVVVSKGPAVPSAIGKHLTLLGDVYTDRKGMTLYTYNCNANGGAGAARVTPVSCEEAGDPAGFMVGTCGDSTECARRWRPYIAAPGAKSEGEFSIIDITYPMFTDMRGGLYPADAPRVKAWAYRGKPLFTYYEDEKPSDIWGSSIGGIWGSTWTALQVPGRSATQLEP